METPLLDALRSIGAREWVSLGEGLLRIALILIAAWTVTTGGNRMIRAMMARLCRATSQDRAQRLETLGLAFRNVLGVVVSLVAGMLILDVLGISVAPILATAGVAGIAIGFGAQSLIKDYFNGFFLLVDDQLRQGDIVQIAGIGGAVEEVTLRYVRLRDYEGNVHFVPNGQIGTVTNRSRDFAFAVIDIGIAYRESVEEAIEAMRAVGREMRADAGVRPEHPRGPRDSRRERMGRFRDRHPLPVQGEGDAAVGRAARIPAEAQGGVRRPRHRDSVSAPHRVRGRAEAGSRARVQRARPPRRGAMTRSTGAFMANPEEPR